MSDEDEDWVEFLSLDDLSRRVTVDSYYAADLAHHASRRSAEDFQTIEKRIKAAKDSLMERELPGDEWWEWIQGTEPLMQSGGIALVRHGKIVYARQDWIS